MNANSPQRKNLSDKGRSRRDFLRTTGGLAAAAALSQASSLHCHAAEENTIKLALVGSGGRGTGAVADAFAAQGGPVKLHAIADLFDDRVQRCLGSLQSQFGERVDVPAERQFLGFDAYQKAIDTLGPGDVVILTTPSVFRPLHFEYAVEKGVNVFMEKSFAVDSPGVRRMLASAEISEQKNLKVGAGFMWRHSLARQETIKRIQDGMIGDLHTLRIYRVHGPVHCAPFPAGQNELEFQIRRPVCFNWLTGGFLIDWHCHNIDVACWAKGSWPVKAQGMGGRVYREAGNLLDHYTVEYTFADGAKLFCFSRHMAGCWDEYADYAHCSNGSAVLMATLAQPKSCIYKNQDMVPENLLWEFGQNDPNPYHREWQVLLDAIRQDRSHNESRRAAEADLASLMGRMATHTGQYVTWDQAMQSNFQYVADIDNMTMETPAPIRADENGLYEAPIPGLTKEI